MQSSLESEASERKTQDEKISKSIGSINNTLLGYIGSSSTSNIGDGTLRGAIGNTSIAGIGTANNLSSAVSGLNTKISNIADGTTSGTFKGTLTGTASKATADANGNTISSTYQKKTDEDWKNFCWGTGTTAQNLSDLIAMNPNEIKIEITVPISTGESYASSTYIMSRLVYSKLNRRMACSSYYYSPTYFVNAFVYYSYTTHQINFDSTWCTGKYGSSTISLSSKWEYVVSYR